MNEYANLIKSVAVLAILALLIYFGYVIWGWKQAAEVNAVTVQQQQRTAEATSQVTTGVQAATADARRVDIVVRQARSDYATQYQSVIATDASAAAWDNQPVPVGLRDAARARRLAHDGLADPSAGSSHSH